MPQRGRVALQVHNLTESLAFYVDGLGATLLNEPSDDMALIFYDDTPILLAGPQVEEVRDHLDEPRIVFKPGDTLDIEENDLDAKIQFLQAHGFADLHEKELPDGGRKVQLEDPSGYKISFIKQRKRSPEEAIALYVKGPDMLEKALQGLSEAELDLRRAPDEWSIRQIVHHLAEGETLFLMTLKLPLAQSGSTLIRPPYDQARWVEVMDYEHRAIEPSLALIRANRQHIKQLLDHIPDSWENYVMSKFADEEGEGNKITVGYIINVMGRHIEEHCAEIMATRQVHNI